MTPTPPRARLYNGLDYAGTLGFIWGGSFLGVEIGLTGFGPITVAWTGCLAC